MSAASLVNLMKEAAIRFIAWGFAITLCDGKRPIGNNWQSASYSAADIETAFAHDPSLNVGVILGERSGMTDVEGDDEQQSEADFLELFDGEEPRTWKFRSRRGTHRLFKYDPRLAALGKSVFKWRTLEIRGCNDKAAQTVFPPSATDGFSREWIVSPDECELAPFPEHVFAKLLPPQPQETVIGTKGRPGDDYNARGPSWSDILVPKGISYVGDDGGHTSYWRRPGKAHGVSATTGHVKTENGEELLYIFSTSMNPLEAGKAYSKFAAYTVLYHDSDYSAAAAELAEQGYGKKSQRNTGPSVATRLIDSIVDNPDVELFHTPDGEAHVTVPIAGHRETMRLAHQRFKQYICREFYADTGTAASTKALGEAMNVLAGMAVYDGLEAVVYLRIAEHEGSIYIDRGSPEWDAIKITPEGYDVISDPPVKFWRSKGILALPQPQSGASVDALRPFVTLRDDQFQLMIAALLSYLRPTGPYPVTIITGEQGTAKSTTADLLRKLVDPKVVQRQADPKNVESLMVAARNNWVVSYDNLSGLPQWFPLFCHWANTLAGPRIWLDHWGTAMADDVPVLVSEPYLTVGYDFSPVREFAERLDCDLVVTKESYWYPGKTIRLALMPKSRALPVDGRHCTTSKTKVD